MSTNRLIPTCGTTGIGSLPYTSVEPAIHLAFQHDVSFVPQLPKVDAAELMIPAALEGLPGVAFDSAGACTVDAAVWSARRDGFTMKIESAIAAKDLTAFEPSAKACSSFAPFLAELKARGSTVAKVQLAGPATVRWLTKTTGGAPLSEEPELDRQVFRLLLARGLAMVKAVRRAGATPMLFWDEPGLHALDLGNGRHVQVLKELEAMILALQNEGALVGLHCCANTQWPAIFGLGFDVVSFDARLSLDAALEDERAFWRFLCGGGRLSLGIVPTDGKVSYRVDELVDSVEASLRATMPRGKTFAEVLDQVLLTPACGLGLHTVAEAERIVGEVRAAHVRLKAI